MSLIVKCPPFPCTSTPARNRGDSPAFYAPLSKPGWDANVKGEEGIRTITQGLRSSRLGLRDCDYRQVCSTAVIQPLDFLSTVLVLKLNSDALFRNSHMQSVTLPSICLQGVSGLGGLTSGTPQQAKPGHWPPKPNGNRAGKEKGKLIHYGPMWKSRGQHAGLSLGGNCHDFEMRRGRTGAGREG